jgi:hypothetical protein
MNYASMYAPASSSSTSSSGTYTPPTNAQTGYAYVATSAAAINAQATIDILS